MIVLGRIRQALASPGYLSTWYMGKIISRKSGKIILEKVCMVFEELVYVYRQDDVERTKPVGTKIEVRYLTNSLITNGQTPYLEEDFLSIREVLPDDEVINGYNSSIEAFRLEKSNLHKASTLPPPPRANPDSRGHAPRSV